MKNINLKWAALFLFLILIPASILTYLSVQTLRDEKRSALVDLNLLVPRLQSACDQLLMQMAQNPTSEFDKAHVTLRRNGTFIAPVVLPLTFDVRSDAFVLAFSRGEDAEFRLRDLNAAQKGYLHARQNVENDVERVEVLNALGRVALANGDVSGAVIYWKQLKSLAHVLDADGAHPLTLRLLHLTQELSFKEVSILVHDWANGVLNGQYPVYRGMSYHVQQLQTWADRYMTRREGLSVQLGHIADWCFLVDVWPTLRSVGMGEFGQVFQSGVHREHESVLVVFRTQNDSLLVATRVNMGGMVDALMQTPVGQEVRQNGFALSLFDVDAAQNFKQRHQNVMHLVAPASATFYRLNFGFYTRGDLQVFKIYRERNTWILMGVFALAGLMGVGVFLMYRDITREVVVAKLRSDFVSNVSHELRTPLTSIRMYAETLFMKRYRNEEQVQTYLETIMRESQRLSRMVGNILDFSRMESGRKTYTFELCDPREIVQTVANEFDPILQEQDFVLTVEVEPEVLQVRVDREALETALANLLSNAMKYSPERKAIRLSVWVQAENVVFEVADRGVGVPSHEQQAIFEKFHRASNAGETATGTGLGLALVKGVMDAHGGSVSYAAREGGGSVFRLFVPVTD